MRRLSRQDLRAYACATHEGAQAYDYSESHPLVHLTFTFGSALFTDAYYETEQEQVRRFARALVDAARVEPAFPWQYGAWMRDPVEGKGNRVQGSLVPALLDALLDESAYTERYVELCLGHRPDDLIAFVAHFRDLGLGEPSAAARRGMARALLRFDEYQLLKYARARGAIRLCDVILMLRKELEALGEPARLALTVGRVLHAPTRDRDALLARAERGEDGLVPLPLWSARRKLFELDRSQVDDPRFTELVAAARVTWEQVVGQFGRSVKLAPEALRAIKRAHAWALPQIFIPELWRLAYLPKLIILEAAQTLETLVEQLPAAAVTELRAKLQRYKGSNTFNKLESLVHDQSLAAEKRQDVLAALRACASEAASPETQQACARILEAVALYDAHDPLFHRLRLELPRLRSRATLEQALDAIRLAVGELTTCLDTFPAADAVSAEGRELARALGQALNDTATVEAFVRVVDLHERRTTAINPLKSQLARFLVSYDPAGAVDVASLTALSESFAAFLAAEREPLEVDTRKAAPVLAAATQRLIRRHERLLGVVHRVVENLRASLGTLAERDALREHNRKVWAPLLSTPNLLGDIALMRNLRNIYNAGATIEDLVATVQGRLFNRIWPHQAYAGFQAVPELEPVFELILGKMVDRLPPGRHLGLADASGSMTIELGGKHSSVSCMNVAFCLTVLMSESSGLGASFSDGSWGDNIYLSIAERAPGEGMLAFSQNPKLKAGMGGTHVFGAVIELIAWLKRHDHITPPDCLWFFSDMQFHPPEASVGKLPDALVAEARELGLDAARPPLELALEIYRRHFGPVDVVLWNLAAYAPVPVPASMPGVLLVSGFDANTFDYVKAWRSGGTLPDAGGGTVEVNQEVVLDAIRRY